jgi:hypothetical protein
VPVRFQHIAEQFAVEIVILDNKNRFRHLPVCPYPPYPPNARIAISLTFRKGC